MFKKKEKSDVYFLTAFLPVLLLFFSCNTGLKTTSISYQSVRTTFPQGEPIPDDAEIVACYDISNEGDLNVVIFNNSDEVMIIDQTLSFFVNSDGLSTSYFDPTVRTTSNTDMHSATKGATFNLGALGGALGIGGTVGKLLGAFNLGGSSTNGYSTTSTTYIADQPRVALAPHSNGAMSKVFKIKGLGRTALKRSNRAFQTDIDYSQSRIKFSVCISYSTDGGNLFNKIVTDFYSNSFIVMPLTDMTKINSTLSSLYQAKPDLLYEPWYIMYFPNNSDHYNYNTVIRGVLYDYQ